MLVVGDVNSTLACTLVAAKKGVPVAHVEAGLRSFDRAMPEEINRVLTDQIADLLYTTERVAHDNLRAKASPPRASHFVGNVMIDSLLAEPRARGAAAGDAAPRRASIPRPSMPAAASACVTLHRPSNVDDAETLGPLLARAARGQRAAAAGLRRCIRARAPTSSGSAWADSLAGTRIAVLPPQGYLEMLGLMSAATLVLTDSGGMQEETTALGVPCLTLRENTERPITVEQGTNTLVGRDRDAIMRVVRRDPARAAASGAACPELWDGRAARAHRRASRRLARAASRAGGVARR